MLAELAELDAAGDLARIYSEMIVFGSLILVALPDATRAVTAGRH